MRDRGNVLCRGRIFNIQRLSVQDGPGIRTTVFMKGCPLRCRWCHNPESWTPETVLALYAQRCTLCGLCEAACARGCHRVEQEAGHRIERNACVRCGKCAEACPAGALELIGREATVREVLEVVCRDRRFYKNSGGGLTLSGGEPLAQPDFASALLREAKAVSLHTCVETSGAVPWEALADILPHTDLFLYDWKESDPMRHRDFTGVSNERIRANLLALDQAGARVILRCPIIPGYNHSPDHYQGIAALAGALKNLAGIELLPYHTLGGSKHGNLGTNDPMAGSEPMTPNRCRPPADWLEKQLGICVTVHGV